MLRVIELKNGDLVSEVCRGTGNVEISSLNLNPTANPEEWQLACTSVQKGTCHIFVISNGKAENQTTSKNTRSVAYFVSGVLPSYFSREFSFARLRLPVES